MVARVETSDTAARFNLGGLSLNTIQNTILDMAYLVMSVLQLLETPAEPVELVD